MATERRTPKNAADGSRSLLILLLFSWLLAAGGVVAAYRLNRNELIDAVHLDLSEILRARSRQIAAWRSDRLGNAIQLANDPLLGEGVERWLSDGDQESRRLLASFLEAYSAPGLYDAAALVGSDGKLLLGSKEATPEIGQQARGWIRQAVSSRQPVLAEMFSDAASPAKCLALMVPVGGGDGSAASPIAAVMVLQIDLDGAIARILQARPTPHGTSEIILLASDTTGALSAGEPGNAAGPLRAEALDPESAAGRFFRTVSSSVETLETVDHLGRNVIAKAGPVEESPWTLVALMDRDVVLSSARSYLARIAGIAFGALGVVSAAFVMVIEATRRRRLREAVAGERQHAALLARYEHLVMEANDIMLVVDDELRIVDANGRAAEAYGRSREQLLGMSLADIVAPTCIDVVRSRIASPSLDAGVRHESRHRRADGSEFRVEVSARRVPIDGRPHVQKIVRDIEERERAAAAMRERDELLRKLTSQLPGFLFQFLRRPDGTTCIPYASEGIRDFYELAPDDVGVRADRTFELMHPVDRPRVMESIRRSAETLAPWRCEFRVVLPRQGVRWREAHSVPERLPDGSVLWHGYAQDITDRKAVDDALRDRDELYRAMVDQATYAVGLVDAHDGRIVEFNDAACEMLGYTREEYAHLTIADIEEDGASVPEELRHLRAMGGGRFENRNRCKDGTLIDVVVSARLVHLKGREYFAAVWTDVTERKRHQAALESERAKLRELVRCIPSMVFMKDLEGRYTACNPAFEEYMGHAESEMLGRTDYDFAAEEAADILRENDRQALAAGGPRVNEEWLTYPDGRRVLVEVTRTPVRDARGEAIGILAISRDITERRRLEEQIQQAQKMETVGRLAGGVAHDFNNMLAVILGNVERVMRRMPFDDPNGAYLAEIDGSARRAAELTRQLLTFARNQPASPRVIDLNAVLGRSREMMASVAGEQIELEQWLDPGLWPVRIDPSQIEQVILNLVVNARDAMQDCGRIAVETENVALAGPGADGIPAGDWVCLRISDTGCGMDAATMERIFEPFFTTKEVGKGTGLGLATVYGILAQNGGAIRVESEPRRGSTFTLWLPRCLEPASILEPSVDTSTPSASGDETILVVEDEESLRDLVADVLRARGFNVLAAGDPAAAIRLCQEFAGEIHLLLTDVIMPGMNGRDLQRAVRAMRPGIRTIFMSGYTSDVMADGGALESGCVFLHKPFSPFKDLIPMIRELLAAK